MTINLKKEQGTIQVHTSLTEIDTEMEFALNEDQALQFGKSLMDIAVSEELQELTLTFNGDKQ